MFIDYLLKEENIAKHTLVYSENEICIKIIKQIFNKITKSQENIDILKSLSTSYITKSIMQTADETAAELCIMLWKIYNTPKLYDEGLKFFNKINLRLDAKPSFFNSIAYEVYFAYQLKKFEIVERFLNSHGIQLLNNTAKLFTPP